MVLWLEHVEMVAGWHHWGIIDGVAFSTKLDPQTGIAMALEATGEGSRSIDG